MVKKPKSKEYVSSGGQPVAVTASSRPHRRSAATPGAWIAWVESVSLGKVARSTSSTRWPARASSIAVGEPAQRAPTTIASYRRAMTVLLRAGDGRTLAGGRAQGIGELTYSVARTARAE